MSLWTPSGTTTLAAVIGSPVRHSLSPAIHNAAFRALGLDWTYLAFEVADGAAAGALAAMRALDLGGLSVTMPHKAAVAALVDELTDDGPPARRGQLRAAGTATAGGRQHRRGRPRRLARATPAWSVGRPRCVVLGAGGAARAVVLALARAGAAEVGGGEPHPRHGPRRPPRWPAPPAGSAPSRGGRRTPTWSSTPRRWAWAPTARVPARPRAPDRDAGQVVVDLVYDPLRTPLLAARPRPGRHRGRRPGHARAPGRRRLRVLDRRGPAGRRDAGRGRRLMRPHLPSRTGPGRGVAIALLRSLTPFGCTSVTDRPSGRKRSCIATIPADGKASKPSIGGPRGSSGHTRNLCPAGCSASLGLDQEDRGVPARR